MKKTRTMAFVLITALLMSNIVSSAEVDNPQTIEDAALLEESSVPEPAKPQNDTKNNLSPVPAAPTQQSEPMALPNANPVHTIDLTTRSIIITYPNGNVFEHDKRFIPLIINGTLIDSDVILVNNRTLAPLRVLTEALGGVVEWDDATKTITIYRGYNIVKMEIGNTTVVVNGEPLTIDVPPSIHNDYAYLPLRFVGETLGAHVSYNTGQYNPSTMKFESYMLVQGVYANATVDEIDPSWPIISEFQAESTVMSVSRKLFNAFKEKNDTENPNKDYTSRYNFILKNIENTRLVGSISRYYVIESFSLFLFDKYTGNIYTIGSDSKSNWVRRYAEGDPANFELFTKGYFFN